MVTGEFLPSFSKSCQLATASDRQACMKLGRTLLTAGVFALLAMIYVPTPAKPHHAAHYRFVFSQDDTSVAFFQLLVNVVFAALLGAILVTIFVRIPKRALYATARCIPIVVIVAVGVGVFVFTEAAANRAQLDEKNGEEVLVLYPKRVTIHAHKISERCNQLATCVAF